MDPGASFLRCAYGYTQPKEKSMTTNKFDPRQDARYPILKARIECHWEQFRPKYFAALEKSRNLEAALSVAAADCVTELHDLQQRGLAPDQAKELAYAMWNQPETQE
jgi:hypothetical protein